MMFHTPPLPQDGQGALSHDILAVLGIEPSWVMRAEPMAGGYSEARLWRLRLRFPLNAAGRGAGYGARRVVKVIKPLAGWLGAATKDKHIREVALWPTGIFGDLPACIATGVERWVFTPTSGPAPSAAEEEKYDRVGILFMRDMQAYLMRDPLRTPPGSLSPFLLMLLDNLAHLHARFWEDPRLREGTPAGALLTPPRAALLLLSPQVIADRLALGYRNPYLPLAQRGWEAFFRLAPPAEAEILQAVLADPTPWLAAIAALPHTLIHGDVWGPNIGLLAPTHGAPHTGKRLLLLDWALTAAAPAPYDPLWLCGAWHSLSPVRLLAAYRARLIRHLAARDIVLSQKQWRGLVDAAYLRTALVSGEAFGRAAEDAPAGSLRKQAVARLHWWAQRGALAARRLLPGVIK